MDEQAKQVLGQMMVLSIQHLFSMAAISGRTPEQLEALYQQELARFKDRSIEDLPLPPE